MKSLQKLGLAFILALSINQSHGTDPVISGLAAYNEGRWQKAFQLLSPVAVNGNPIAQTLLGLMYFHGNGTDENEELAFELFSTAADQGYAEAQYHLGNMYIYGHAKIDPETDPDTTAAKWIIRAATQGYSDAEYTLGLLLLAGTGVIQNPEEAEIWIRRAADSGHPQAKAFIGEYTSK